MEDVIRCGKCKTAKPPEGFAPSQRSNGHWCRECFHQHHIDTRDERRRQSHAKYEATRVEKIAYVRAWKIRQLGGLVDRHCVWCKTFIRAQPRELKRPRTFCSPHCKSRQRSFLATIALRLAKPERWCAWCGAKLSTARRSDAYYCTDQCLNDAHVATANFRRRTKDTKVRTEPRFSMFDLGERDGWVCGICSKPLDRSLEWPDPQSISIDHIIPISKGGPHLAPSNLRLTHLTCNVVRRAA